MQSSVAWAGVDPVAELSVEIANQQVFVPVEVEGSETLWFVLDTGASRCVLHDRTVEALELETGNTFQASGAGAETIDARFVPGVSLVVGGAVVPELGAIAIDLEGIERRIGRPIDGILGYELFDEYTVELDYENERLSLYEPGEWKADASGFSVPIDLAQNHIVMPAMISLSGREPMEVDLLVDTGAGVDIVLTSPFARQTGALETLEWSITNDFGRGIAGKTVSILGPLGSISVGGITMEGPVASVSQDQSGAASWSSIDGILGSGVLERFTVTFDYADERLHFEPNGRIEDAFDTDLLGVIWVAGGADAWHDITIEGVWPGSVAEQSGLRKGDRLVSFDGIENSALTISDLYESTQALGAKITLQIERDGERIEQSVVLEEWFK